MAAHSVGIGAYLVRLGQRLVQVEGQPVILMGAPALNKVPGREAYTSNGSAPPLSLSNLQLSGGTQIMHKNNVSHLVASSDLDGATPILQWLWYVPNVKALKGAQLPVMPSSYKWDRDIGFFPPKG